MVQPALFCGRLVPEGLLMFFRRKPCDGCAARDKELARVWSLLTSSRTIIREPDVVQIVEPPEGQARRAPEEHAQPIPEAFSRNPITYDQMEPIEAEGPVGEDVASEVMRLNAERRARIAARRES